MGRGRRTIPSQRTGESEVRTADTRDGRSHDPYGISWSLIPNKLVKEVRALARCAAKEIPLRNELAADIFMGKFSEELLKSARAAADFLDGSLYATYYGIEFESGESPRNERAARGQGRTSTTSLDSARRAPVFPLARGALPPVG